MKKNSVYELHTNNDYSLPMVSDSIYRDSGILKNIRYHWHQEIEFLYIVAGEGICYCDNREYRLTPKNIVIINANDIHSIYTNSRIFYHYLLIDSDFCITNGVNVDNINFSSNIYDEHLISLVENLLEEYHNDIPFKELQIKKSLLEILLYTIQNHSVNTTLPFRQDDLSIKLAIGYIKSHYNNKITIDMLCSEVGLEKCYFIKKFRRTTGYSPIKFINLIRCNQAANLIKNSQYNIQEIALMCGFNNFSYFSKTFKQYCGCVPSEYLKLIKKDIQT